MTARKVLLCCALLGALLIPSRATAQIEDDFANGLSSSVPWRWDVPGNTPNNTEDPNNYSFSANSLNITAQPGSLYGSNNNALNIPNLVIATQPDNWYVETAVSTDWSMASTDKYVHAGLVFLADADNYFSFYNNRNAGAGHNARVQVSSTFEAFGSPDYGGISSVDWDPTQDYVKLRVEGTPTQITFLYKHSGPWTVAGTVSAMNHGDVFAFLSSLEGMRVGLETDTGGGVNTSPFSFNYVKTNLVVAQSEDDFAGAFKASIPWTFDTPGNNPTNTEDPSHYAFSSNSLDITIQDGSIYGTSNNAHNLPNLVILGQPDYWFVETAVSTDWSTAAEDKYVHAGLVILADADNYYSFYNNRNAGAGHTPSVQVSTTIEVGSSANYGNISSADWDPTLDPVKLRIEGTPTQVTFLYDHTGTWQVAGTASATNHPEVYALVSSLVGMRVCLETDSGGTPIMNTFSFHYFKTNLVVSP